MELNEELIVRAIGEKKIAGYAMVWYDPSNAGTEYNMFDNVYERINRSAVEDIPEGVIYTFNHNYQHPEGIYPDNLVIRNDDKGLYYECELFDSASARVLMQRVKSGKVKGSSFTALAKSAWHKEGKKDIRTITKITDLQELASVENPAYTATQAKIRSLESERKEWVETEKRIYDARMMLKVQL